MTNKYYTPEIDELCVGFEYEVVAAPRDYADHHVKFTFPDFRDIAGIKGLLEHKKAVRVKYLDKQDVEDCGFEHIAGRNFDDFYRHIKTKIGLFVPKKRIDIVKYSYS